MSAAADQSRARFDELLAQHLVGGLDADGRIELAGLAAGSAELAERLRGHAELHVLLAELYGAAGSRSMAARVLHAHARRGDSARFIERVVGQVARRTTHRRRPASFQRWWWLALAAGLLVGVIFTLSPVPEASSFARIVALSGGSAEIAGRPARAGDVWPAGQILVLGDQARMEIHLNDGSTLSVSGAARMVGAAGDDGVLLDLMRGRVAVVAAKQTPGRTLSVISAQARVSVLGTRFVVDAGEAATQVAVQEGRVAVIVGGERHELGAGEAAEASAGRLRLHPRRIQILFGAKGTPLPAGALLDQAKAWDETRGYGWDGNPDEPIEVMTTNRGLMRGKRVGADVVLKNRKPQYGYVSAGMFSEDRWRLRLPPGRYRVSVTVGDPGHPQGEHRVVVEGVALVTGVITDNELHQASAEIDVMDGELTMQVGGTNRPHGDGSADTVLSELVVERLGR